MKKLLIGVVVVLGFFWILGKVGGSGTNITNDENTYAMPWRSPTGDEYTKLGKLILKNNVKGCGEYHVKEVTPNEYLIACSPDGKEWRYLVAWPTQDKIYLASVEMEEKLTPPY